MSASEEVHRLESEESTGEDEGTDRKRAPGACYRLCTVYFSCEDKDALSLV
jgi:hypothetical protein